MRYIRMLEEPIVVSCERKGFDKNVKDKQKEAIKTPCLEVIDLVAEDSFSNKTCEIIELDDSNTDDIVIPTTPVSSNHFPQLINTHFYDRAILRNLYETHLSTNYTDSKEIINNCKNANKIKIGISNKDILKEVNNQQSSNKSEESDVIILEPPTDSNERSKVVKNFKTIDLVKDCSDDDVVLVDSPNNSKNKSKNKLKKTKKLNKKMTKKQKSIASKLKKKETRTKTSIKPFDMAQNILNPSSHSMQVMPKTTFMPINFSSNNMTLNVYNPNKDGRKKEGLRPIVIDGSNVAIGHGKGSFSVQGLKICVDFFLKRGHQHIKVFIPQYRKNKGNFEELEELEKRGILILTPSRRVDSKWVVPYDDRYIIQYAVETEGIVVSDDNFRDLYAENPLWRETITSRLLMFTWIDDLLMFPQDPLGRYGPTLDQFLRF
uniref:RNase NYN domain-containing protein n=1 Tax=Clastoptera arizonana TaxID=38151 RepID=A0A1B6DCV5_9HEMI